MRSPFSRERRGARTGAARAAGPAAFVVGLLWLSACAVANVDVSAEDESVFFPGGRLSWGLDRGLEPTGEGGAPERAGSAVSLDLDVSRGSGGGGQSLSSDQVVVHGGGVFRGPRELWVDFDLTRALIDVRVASSPLGGVSIEGFGGLEYSVMQVNVRAGDPVTGPSGSSEVRALGPAFGLALAWQATALLRLSAEGRVGLGLSSEADGVELLSLDLGVDFFPLEAVGLFAGWRTVSYQAESVNAFESGLDFGLSGPVLALWIRL